MVRTKSEIHKPNKQGGLWSVTPKGGSQTDFSALNGTYFHTFNHQSARAYCSMLVLPTTLTPAWKSGKSRANFTRLEQVVFSISMSEPSDLKTRRISRVRFATTALTQ